MNPHADTSAQTLSQGVIPSDRSVDVLVIGGGPAGSATAIALARLGRSVTVLERSSYGAPRIGETLPPEIKRPLIELGAWESFLADCHIESPGTVVSWGHSRLYDNDFIVNPNGPGWHVDRRLFDLRLARVAEGTGVEVLLNAQVVALDRLTRSREGQATFRPTSNRARKAPHLVGKPDSDSESRARFPWQVGVSAAGRHFGRRAAVLVDATGRRASLARRFAGHRLVFDRLVGLAGFVDANETSRDRRTLVEAVEYGYWYSAPLPDGRQIGALMTDADLLPGSKAAWPRFWLDQLRQSAHVRARLGGGDLAFDPQIHAACSSRSSIVARNGRLAVGEAAAAFDPLSSQGVVWALESGLTAARAIDRHLEGCGQAISAYSLWVESEFAEYLAARADYYGRESRWPASKFWSRRRGTALAARRENSGNSRKGIQVHSYP